MNKQILSFIIILLSGSSLLAQKALLAFPSAEGYGKYATGGRGGKVVFVDNLDDYIAYQNLEKPVPGSFRWALTQYPGEPLTIIFRVSGTIVLKPYMLKDVNKNDIRSSRPHLTIAGQTAPGEGICIRNSKVNFGGSSDLIVRNVRFRIGENAADSSFIPGAGVGIENATRVILDHCVFGWSGEENLTMYDNRFTTVQWSIFHDALYNDGHEKGKRGYGSQTGGVCATYHHNLWANNKNRSPRLNGARSNTETNVFIEFINNVVYNWGNTNAAYGGDIAARGIRTHYCNFVNNYYKPGPSTPAGPRYFFTNYIVDGASSIPRWHLAGNVMEGNSSATKNNWSAFTWKWSSTPGKALPTQLTASSDTMLKPASAMLYDNVPVPYSTCKLTKIQSAIAARNAIIARAGTINRDSVERRVISDLKKGTASFTGSLGAAFPGMIDKSFNAEGYLPYKAATPPIDSDNDGMPDNWEKANGLDPNNPDDRNRTNSDGYTALEIYLADLMGEKIAHNFSTRK